MKPARDAPARTPAPWRSSAGAAALLGFVVPGLGHVLLGRPGKALLFFGVILGTYALGLWLSDWRCVHYERYQVWFFAQAFAAGPTALTAWLTQDLTVSSVIPQFDVGQLYVGVAALLNAVAVADAIGTAQEIRDGLSLEASAREHAALEEARRITADSRPPDSHPATAAQDEWPSPPEAPGQGPAPSPASSTGPTWDAPPPPPEAPPAAAIEAPSPPEPLL